MRDARPFGAIHFAGYHNGQDAIGKGLDSFRDNAKPPAGGKIATPGKFG